jgi:hypothetical protein
VNIEVSRSRRIGEEAYNQVCTMSAKLFAGIRFFFVKYVRNKLNAFFLDPMYVALFLLFLLRASHLLLSCRFQRLGGEVTDHFRKLTDDRFSELFALGAVELKERAVMLENQLVHCTASRDRFKEGTPVLPQLYHQHHQSDRHCAPQSISACSAERTVRKGGREINNTGADRPRVVGGGGWILCHLLETSM